ncbi:hypothetical protein [Mycobacterium sp. 852002-53434_SCH5985345]|uniref:hypothetical protein n=1 Tax=Mycobacterium sp. 852002-53434_SCH5985345 TaxID=1834107 RepID=UPI000B167BA8|nr:hypothetical protein [Mycobacterium sp. 852002-53434_SCH5985345]
MTRRRADEASNNTADDPKSEPKRGAEQVVPEEGEGPFPPVAGVPRPPIGN